MRIHTTLNPVAYQTTYYLENDSHLLVIDPGSDWDTIEKTIRRLDKPVAAILLTHTHYDHIMSLEKVRAAFGQPPVYVAESEASWLYTPEMNLSGLDRHADLDDVVCQPAEEHFRYESPYQLAGFSFFVLPTPGHSIGGVSLVFPESRLVLTGDALFRETIGRTDLPTGNYQDLIEGIKQQLFSLPDDYAVYPGHGPATSIGHEKSHNPHFQGN